MSRTKEAIIESNVKDFANKALSLYNNGYKAGKNDGYAEGREAGIITGWTMAKGLAEMSWERFSKAFPGYESIAEVLFAMSHEDVAKRLTELYDEELHAELKVGDEIRDSNGLIGIVTNTDTHYHIFYPHNGKTWKAPKSARLEKIGSDVQIILRDPLGDLEYEL